MMVHSKARGMTKKFVRVGIGEPPSGEDLYFPTVFGTVGDDRGKASGAQTSPQVFEESFRTRKPLQNRAREHEIEPVGPGDALGVAREQSGLFANRFGKALSGFPGKFEGEIVEPQGIDFRTGGERPAPAARAAARRCPPDGRVSGSSGPCRSPLRRPVRRTCAA